MTSSAPTPAVAARPDAQAEPWLRDPAISPDGTRIAFRCAGQIWIAPAAGGDALALTPAGLHAATPVWSPEDAASYREAFSDIFGRFGDAQGLVVDIRDNGGGNLHNNLVTLLSGRTYAAVVPPRGGPRQDEPRDRWTKPSAVVMNAASYSDSSLFPLAYRDLHLGPLVGDPVAGTGTAVW